MCLQLVCHICGGDFEDDKSFVLCLNPVLALRLLFGDRKICPDYVRMEADTPYRCNFCSKIDPITVGASPASRNHGFAYNE